MLSIVRVIRQSNTNARCLFDNGLTAKVPLFVVEEGSLSEEDLVEVSVSSYKKDYIHKSLWKPKRQPRTPTLVRDMSDFDATTEVQLLEVLVKRHQSILKKRLKPEEVSDLASELFLHFWERNYYQGYNNSKCKNYLAYLSRGVKNYFIDITRRASFKDEVFQISLNTPVGKEAEESAQLLDFLEDTRVNVDAQVGLQFLIADMQRIVEELDFQGTGISISYKEIFDVLLGRTKTSLEDLAIRSGYSTTTVKLRRDKLISRLRTVYKEYAVC